MYPEGCNEDIDDDRDGDQAGGRVVELVKLALLSYLIEVPTCCGPSGELRVSVSSQPKTSPAASTRGQRKSGTVEIRVAKSKGGGRHQAVPPSPSPGFGNFHWVLQVGHTLTLKAIRTSAKSKGRESFSRYRGGTTMWETRRQDRDLLLLCRSC